MSKGTEQLSDNFLDELFKLCLFKRDVIDIVVEHLDYSYIPVELKDYKLVLKSITDFYRTTNKLPTIGYISQTHQTEGVYDILTRIQNMNLPDKETTLNTLEDYIKKTRFQKLYLKIADVYNEGRQQDAIELQAAESVDIVNFTLKKNTQYFSDVFGEFSQRDDERFQDHHVNFGQITNKVAFGIDYIDAHTEGGSEPGETDCFLGRSGSGKTKWLRWRGVSAARRGYSVLHIQGEGTEKECLLGYDATWTAVYKRFLKNGDIDSAKFKQLEKIAKDIQDKKGGITVKAFEQFDTASMRDVRQAVLDYIKVKGHPPRVLILDYLELFDPGDGKRYPASTEGEKMRREATARKFKNICNEFGCTGATATQANDIAPSDYNRVDWVMTRHNVSGAKGLPDSFSYLFTWNVSSDEYKSKTGRLYCDKMREYESQQVIRIATAFDRDRFYDRTRTLELFESDYSK
jgi:hypothetical protein